MSPLIASRIDSSSSTTEIWGFAFVTLPPSSGLSGRLTCCNLNPRAYEQLNKDKKKSRGPRLYFGLKGIAGSISTAGFRGSWSGKKVLSSATLRF
jgi:hypothetical protein